ncbi:S1 family peptidase [Amycolatopsis azurea]|uniref:S1 family peptidase n=1 Tax=Amycolatopsis azurea TaxID=36819 RepID=UPI0038023E58
MRKTVIASIAAAALTGVLAAPAMAQDAVQPNLVGGSPATGETGWAVSMQIKGRGHICTGTLMFRDMVVIPSHCAFKEIGGTVPWDPAQVIVRVGSKDRTSGGEMLEVARVDPHEKFEWLSGPEAYDVGALKLAKSANQQPLRLGGETTKPGTKVTMYGWGTDLPSGDTKNLPRKLQKLDTTIVDREKCADAGIGVYEICTDNPYGTDGPGGGDSGGPVVEMVDGEPRFVGIISRARDGALPGQDETVATDATAFRTWLYEKDRRVAATSAA